MFGRPQWFRPKMIGWGLVPITWQGWLYTGAWTGTMVLPFLLLLGRHQPVEAMAWMALTTGALVSDVWQILRALRGPSGSGPVTTSPAKPTDNVLYIMDSQPCQAAATRNYHLQVRR
jgi:hypothetical protein